MKIVSKFLVVVFLIASLLICFSFVRIVVTGNTDNILSFTFFMEKITAIDFDMTWLLTDIDNTLNGLIGPFEEFISMTSTNWDNSSWYEKIGSIFVGIYKFFEGLVNVIQAVIYLITDSIQFLANFFAVFVDLLRDLFGINLPSST